MRRCFGHIRARKQRKYFFNYDSAKVMVCPEDGLKEPGRQMRTVWDIPNNKGREELRFGKHPTQKPIRLLRRMLSLSAREGDLLLVPFAARDPIVWPRRSWDCTSWRLKPMMNTFGFAASGFPIGLRSRCLSIELPVRQPQRLTIQWSSRRGGLRRYRR